MFDFQDMDFETAAEIDHSGPYIPPASECMRCGICVSVCPTFKLFQIDQETPRRRLRTISKLLVEDSPISDEERIHLHNCLQCRACEPACPSHMAYGQLFDQAQVKLQTSPDWLAKLAFWMIEQKHWRARLMPLLSLYLKTGLQKPIRKSGLLKILGLADAEALLGQPALKPLNSLYPTRTVRRGAVALFTGCIAEQFDRDTLIASIKLLNIIGFDVLVPQQQGCCGAIHQHNGQSAAELIANNLRVFNTLDVEAVIHTASGCGVMLSEYQTEDTASLQQFCQRLADINSFLLQHWPDSLKLEPARLKVAVHEPCSQRNLLKNQQAVYGLLEKIPDMTVVPLANNAICCGAGGSYMLTHPENAAQLRALKHAAIHQAQADCVVSSNFGCAVFLTAKANKIVHPLVLLAQQLPS
jgi:glycolate dehydrogenase iron-sulfur subunit